MPTDFLQKGDYGALCRDLACNSQANKEGGEGTQLTLTQCTSQTDQAEQSEVTYWHQLGTNAHSGEYGPHSALGVQEETGHL